MSDSKRDGITKDFLTETDKNPSCIMPEKLSLDSPLKFECHPGVSCFTACCHNIRIVLTPYDILMLRQRLKLSAHEFITQYTDPIYLEKTDMPGVQLKLVGDKQGCPFVTPEGCTVYADRPTACRYYPVGMADFHEAGQEGGEEKFFFLVKEPHCKGFDEPKTWTIRAWREDQGVELRDEMNKAWLRLVMRRKSFSLQATLSEAAQRMFFMASTDLDHFRRFIFESSFLQTYEIDQETVEQIRQDDVALMHFSFKYLANTLFGAEGMNMNKEKVAAKVKSMRHEQEENLRQLEEEYKQLKAEREAQRQKDEAARKQS
ncbi:YkgJ family cysteine cluster protein [Candidatus Electronema sp. JM]|uniref:YkgJ family cysteine cluster protein n=1 Tax=Candidatus Electronema sp. JM TaxID=3401571 RepID=UPI003AA805FD